ncbi:hypothetical protein I5E68_09850 [Novosphingobium sp. YJ-S2-02]|uniref:Winged helix-turn-helix domain-containing protein n=1 Tax=Novosphingobium aureum TaxID=2792964 RepID=A0A931HD40_9SPHN|nr:hypothetical protein [Novosphingobium aureum]MBH0113248.1 hypothetical protein [Novosphingobium aureum]
MSKPHLDETLKQWATPRQIEYIDAVNLHGSARKAAAALGVNKSAVQNAIHSIKAKAAVQGYSPEHTLTEVVAPGYVGRGHSTMYRVDPETGEKAPILQWVKTRADEDARARIVEEAFAAMAGDLPRLAPVKPPRLTSAALCNLYTMTDCHVGMLAWHREGGADWDLRIAERVLSGCFEKMVEASPAADTCIINQLGDWLHQDSIEAVTPTSRHLLDADGRFPKVVQASLRILRRMIDVALRRHNRVIVVMAEGNHDITSSIWLRVMFAALYENEPRVEVDDSSLPYYVHRHGATMLGFHHGHLKKNDQLPGLFAAQFPKIWGETTKRYAHCGHRHHESVKEHAGMKVIQHPTLAARDAHAARGGWLSERQVTGYTYHVEHGQVGSVTVTPEMLG